MKRKSKIIRILAITLFILSSCGSEGYGEKIIGTWETSIFVDSKKARTVFEMDDVVDIEMEMTANTSTQYLRGGRYNSEGDVTFRIKANGQEIPLKLHMRQSGSWEFQENYLISVAEDSKVTPADNATRNFMKNSPEFKEMIEPVKGEATSTEIIEMDETSMQVKEESLPGLLITYQKK